MSESVYYNDDLVSLYAELTSKKLISQNFADFARSAFHDKVDKLRITSDVNDISHDTIENMAFETVKQSTKKDT